MKTQRRWFEFVGLFFLSVTLTVLACAAPAAELGTSVNPIPAGEVLFPASLGTIKERYDGASGHGTVFLIGENHVSLDSQQKLTRTLRYLRGAYGVKVICVEGMNGSLSLADPGDLLVARRAVADVNLAGREINGIDHFALSYPDVRIIGVEDMEAYAKHDAAIRAAPPAPELQAWNERFGAFLGDLERTLPADQARLVVGELEDLKRTKDLRRFLEQLGQILGHENPTGRRLAGLVKELDDAQWAAVERLQSEPLMLRRNQAITKATLEQAERGPVALVVGSLHIKGIAELLRKADGSFVKVLITGVEENPFIMKSSPEDQKIYDDLKAGKPGALEAWISRLKPSSPLVRPRALHAVYTLSALFHADQMLRDGASKEDVVATARTAASGLEISGEAPIRGGHRIDFTAEGRPAAAYFSNQPLPELLDVDRPGLIKNGSGGGIYYALFERGPGAPPPPILPPPPPGSGPSDPFDPSGFNGRLIRAIDDQEKSNPHAVTIAVLSDQGGVRLRIGRYTRWVPLSAAALSQLLDAYRSAETGEESVRTAQEIAAVLLVDVDRDLPDGRRILYQLSQDDLLGNLSLPAIAALSAEPGAVRFASFEEIRTLPWARAQNDLGRLSLAPAPVAIEKTVFWITTDLQQDPHHAAAAEAIQAAGAHLNEPLQPGNALVLMGSAKGAGTFTLTDGSTMTTHDDRFRAALQEAQGVVSLGVAIAKEARAGVDHLEVAGLDAAETLALGSELAQDIRDGEGKETLDRAVRKRSSAERTKSPEQITRRGWAEEFSEGSKGRLKADKQATVMGA